MADGARAYPPYDRREPDSEAGGGAPVGSSIAVPRCTARSPVLRRGAPRRTARGLTERWARQAHVGSMYQRGNHFVLRDQCDRHVPLGDQRHRRAVGGMDGEALGAIDLDRLHIRQPRDAEFGKLLGRDVPNVEGDRRDRLLGAVVRSGSVCRCSSSKSLLITGPLLRHRSYRLLVNEAFG